MFNKYKWLEEQTESLIEYIKEDHKNGNRTDLDSLQEKLHIDLDTEVIYYNHCWDICKELASPCEWDLSEWGPINNVSQLAYAALYEWAMQKIDLEELLEETQSELDNEELA